MKWWALGARGVLVATGVTAVMVVAAATVVTAVVSPAAAQRPTEERRGAALVRSATEAVEPVETRPNKVPAGAVQVTPAPAAPAVNGRQIAPALRRPRTSDFLRVPLSAEPGLVSSGPSLTPDIFGIAAGAGRIDATRADAPVLEVPKGSFTIVTSQRGNENLESEELNTEQKTALPWLLVETPRNATEPPLRTSRPFVTLARAITWDAGLSRHVAEFLFGLDAENGEPGPLREAITVRFGVSCDAVTPDRAQIATIGPTGYDTVRVVCSREVKNESERQYLELFAGQGNLRYPFRIPRRPGALHLDVAGSNTLSGFGFGAAVLTASQVEEDGTLLASDEARVIQLSAVGGGIDVSSVTIEPGQSVGRVEVRPSGIGQLEITASSGAQRSRAAHLDLKWPLSPIAAMLGGGALGGMVSAFRQRRRRQMLRRSFEGAVLGLLVTLTVLVVPGLATIATRALGTELGLFVVAALAGFVGVPLVDRAARLVFPSLNAEPSAKTGGDDAKAA